MFRKLIMASVVVLAGTFASSTAALAQAGQPASETAPAAPVALPPPTPAPPAPTAEPVKVDPAAADAKADPAAADAKADPKAGAPKAAKKKGKEKKAKEKKLTVDEMYPFTDLEPDSFWLPAMSASSNDHTDAMFGFIYYLSLFCFVAITFAVFYLTWRYRNRPGHKAEPSRAHDNILEVTWTIIPSIICVFIFLGGWKGYLKMTTPPSNAMDITVIGKKWNWSFNYTSPDGKESLDNQNVLHVPVGQAVKLIMRSEDVVHSFFIPSVRIKQDVIPGRYTYLTFVADKPGVYRVYCAEYCGNAHSDMKTRLVVHESGEYKKWIQGAIDATKIDCKADFPDDEEARNECLQGQGEGIYDRFGCKQCHTTDGSASTGPTFQGMWGQSRNFTDGSTGAVDENYIRESVLEPMAKVRSGFNPVMPTFKGKLNDKDIDALIQWMKGQ